MSVWQSKVRFNLFVKYMKYLDSVMWDISLLVSAAVQFCNFQNLFLLFENRKLVEILMTRKDFDAFCSFCSAEILTFVPVLKI